jgi:hypothetical protein
MRVFKAGGVSFRKARVRFESKAHVRFETAFVFRLQGLQHP